MANRKFHAVPKQFDDQLEALATFVANRELTAGGVDVEELNGALAQQRVERQKDLELARQANAFHQTFLAAQATRYALYMRVLDTLRATYRDDVEVQAALQQFKRRSRRRASSQATEPKVAA